MKSVRTWNRALWGVNALLAAALLMFGGRFLVFPTKIDGLKDVDASLAAPSSTGTAKRPADEEALVALRNPLRPPGSPPNPAPRASSLLGALPAHDASGGAAFVKSGGSETIARLGEEILKDGKPLREFHGWRLSELWKDRAAFTNRQGERFELTIGSTHETPAMPTLAGVPYHPEMYRSRRLAATEGREIWGIDGAELDWAAQNVRELLDRDVQISPFAGGGLRLDALNPGSMAAARGLKTGDVLKHVNGRPLHSLSDLQSILSNPPQSTLLLTLDRAGKTVVIEYRALPR